MTHHTNHPSTLKAVVWDWNGTLLDDVDAGLATTNAVLAAHGRPQLAGRAHYRDQFGFPVREFYRRLGFEADEDFLAASRAYVAAWPHHSRDAQLHDGVREVLASIRGLGLVQVLVSATESSALVGQLAPFGLASQFDEVHGGDDAINPAKEHVVAAWLQRSGLRPDEVTMVGDTRHDAQIADALGCRFIRVEHGHQSADPDATHPAVDSLSEVAQLVRRWAAPGGVGGDL